MKLFAPALLIAAFVGCDSGPAAVTDPSQLKPLTEDEKKALRAEDQQVADEETANRTPAVKGKAAAAKSRD